MLTLREGRPDRDLEHDCPTQTNQSGRRPSKTRFAGQPHKPAIRAIHPARCFDASQLADQPGPHMSDQRWLLGLQVLTTFFLVVGLVFVVWELRQAKQIALVEYQEARINAGVQTGFLTAGDSLAESLARIESGSAEITDADLIRYDAYVASVVIFGIWGRQVAELGFTDRDWRAAGPMATPCLYFGHPVGRAYLRSPAWPDQEHPVIVHLQTVADQCTDRQSYLKFMRKELVSEGLRPVAADAPADANRG
ncbi:MAG: hypothetical protein AAGG11_22880 [Pseudomonadota bacterium]